MSDLKRPTIGVGVYICHQGKVLCIKRKGKHAGESWTVPGGHLEFGEGWEQTAAREALEEVGVVIRQPRLFGITNDVFTEEGKHSVTLHVEAVADNASFANNEPHFQEQLGWYEWGDIPQPHALWLTHLLEQGAQPSYLKEKAIHAA
jgi:8-oxo-dGTP diphosphatase